MDLAKIGSYLLPLPLLTMTTTLLGIDLTHRFCRRLYRRLYRRLLRHLCRHLCRLVCSPIHMHNCTFVFRTNMRSVELIINDNHIDAAATGGAEEDSAGNGSTQVVQTGRYTFFQIL